MVLNRLKAVLIYFRAFVLLIKIPIRFTHLSGSFSRVPGKLVSGSTHSCKWSSQNFTGPSFLALFNFQGPGRFRLAFWPFGTARPFVRRLTIIPNQLPYVNPFFDFFCFFFQKHIFSR
jgi:hypothetical protein